jgi:hypothetical protein
VSESGSEEEVKPAKYWADKITGEHRGVLSEEQLLEIDETVNATFHRNVKTMLYGEVIHKIMEVTIRAKGGKINLLKTISELIDGVEYEDGIKKMG